MRNRVIMNACVVLCVVVGASSVWASVEQDRDEINKSFTLPARARVEVVAINGSVDIKAIDGDTATVQLERTARSRAELDCNRIVLKQAAGNLIILSENTGDCGTIQVRHRLLLSLPRSVYLSVNGVSGRVNIGEMEGALRISGNSGNINLEGPARGSIISGNSGTTTIKLQKLGPRGLELIGNSGPIKLYIADELNAVVRVTGISGSVSSELPNVRFIKTGAADYYARIGSGGPTIDVPGHAGNILLSPQVMPAPPAIPARPTSLTNLTDGSNISDPCWTSFLVGDFEGSITESDASGQIVIYERVGRVGSNRVVQKRFGDLRLCFVAEDVAERTPGLPSQWLGDASHWLMEVRLLDRVQRLETSGGGLSWTVDGHERAFDADARRWRDRMLAMLDTTWELSTLHGQVSSMRGEISSIQGERSSLLGEISSLQGHVSSLRGEISSILGQESSMRGEISSIQGHLSSLLGQISSERGAISSLNASGNYRATASEREVIASTVGRHEAEIRRIEQQIRDYDADARVAEVQRRIARYDAHARVAEIEAEIRAFNLEGKVADVRRQIAALDVERKVTAIEKKIDALDAERRTRELEDRQKEQLSELEAAIRGVR